MSNNSKIPLLSIDVALPIQDFRFEYTLVGKSDLPFIREFILRLLKLGNMSVTQLAKFLGLSDKEISIALHQLIDLEEIFIDNEGNIKLTIEAHKYFDISANSRPKITKVFEGTHTFRFDLISFNLIKSNETTSIPHNALRISPEPEAASNSEVHARTAFLRNYIDIFEQESMRFDDINSSQKIELYKLSDVRKNRDGYVRFSFTLLFNTERNSFERSSKSPFFEIEAIQEKLNDRLLSSSQSSNIKEISSVLQDIKEQTLLNCFTTANGIDLTQFTILSAQKYSDKTDRKYFLGTPTQSGYWNDILDRLKKYLKDNKQKPVPCYLLAPSDKFWMMSQQAFEKISSLASMKDLHTTIYVPINNSKDRSQINFWKKHLGPLKDKAITISEGFMNGTVELIIIPEVVCLFCFYLQQEGEPISIPFGFFTTNELEINNFHQDLLSFLQSYDADMNLKEYGRLIEPRQQD